MKKYAYLTKNETSGSQFSVATYNVHQWIGMDGNHDPARVIRVIRELKADIVGLQEVHFLDGAGNACNARYLADATGMEVISAPTLRRKRGSFGNVLMTSHRVMGVRRVNLSVYSREPRGALDVDLRVNGCAVRVIVAHLGLTPFERRKQVRTLLEDLSADSTDLVVMMGDFNLWVPISTSLRRLGRHFGHNGAPRTFPSFFPFLPLDRIWVSPKQALMKISAHRTHSARIASDHLPVKATIRLDAPRSSKGCVG